MSKQLTKRNKEIIKMWRNRYRTPEIAKLFKISKQRVSQIIHRYTIDKSK